MNRQLSRLYLLFSVLFLALVFATAWWSVVGAKGLRNNPLNRRPLLEEQQIPRGLILADDGTRLAINRRLGSRETRRYYRVYPTGGLFSHAVGYAFISHGSSGLEKSTPRSTRGRSARRCRRSRAATVRSSRSIPPRAR
jgi:hypothetical protein